MAFEGIYEGRQVEDANGAPVSGAKIYFYKRNTLTLQAAYTDEALTTPASNPVIADSAGYYNVYLSPFLEYDIAIKSADDATTYAGYARASGAGAESSDAYIVVDTLSELQNLTGADPEDVVHLIGRVSAGDGAGGEFYWVSGDQSASVTADEITSSGGDGGIWVAPSTDLTGASGAWKRIYNGNVKMEWYGAGAGSATIDQAAFEVVAAQGLFVELAVNTTYKLNDGVSAADGFGWSAGYGATIQLVTQASGSGSAGFKNYSGADAGRNGPNGSAFILASGGTFNFAGDVLFELDGSNQPIVRPFFAQGCYMNSFGRIRVNGFNAMSGALCLNEMLGGYINALEVTGTADMVDSAYTNLTNFSPNGLFVDDTGTFRSSRMTFGDIYVSDLNRDSGGADPYESDGITLGGIGKSVRTGAKEGHIFNSVEVVNVGEGIDIQQSRCVVKSFVAEDVLETGVKMAHGAQYNRVDHVAIDGYGLAAIVFAGSGTTSSATAYNTISGGNVRRGGKVGAGATVQAVLFQENGGTGVASNNVVILGQVTVDSDTDYLAKCNHSTTGKKNRVFIRDVIGTLATSAASTAANDNLKLRVPGSFVKMTLSADQTPLTTATNTIVAFATADTDLLSEADTGNNKVRCKYPGVKQVRGKIRATLNTGDAVSIRILKNSAIVAFTQLQAVSGSTEQTYEVAAQVLISENDAGTSAADLQIQVNITSGGTITITDTDSATFFEVSDLAA